MTQTPSSDALPEGGPAAEQGHPAPREREPLWRHMLGEQLRGLRHDQGRTLGAVADRAGVSPQYLSEMERGAKEPSSEMIAAVAGALDVSLLDLTTGVAERLGSAAGRGEAAGLRRSEVALAA